MNIKKTALATLSAASLLLGSTSLMAAPVVINTALSDIGTAFDDVITGTGSTVATAQVVNGVSTYSYTDANGDPATVTVTRPDGSSVSPSASYAGLSGSAWSINPRSSSSDPIPGYNSGLTFTFSSAVNAFGFEVGDWATCCMTGSRPADIVSDYGVPANGSGLWIAFDGGAATLPANALSRNDNPGYVKGEGYTNFIGAIDSSDYFTSITFFGDGFGEYLVAGGTLRFASVPIGSVGTVPLPAAAWLFGTGLVGLIGASRRKKAMNA